MEMDKELWRLRLNWIFIWLMAPLYSVSQFGTSSSFHQFVTNPTLEQIQGNSTDNDVQIEVGLGETELFYSLLIAGFEFGAVVGGLTCGFLVEVVPYWYLWAIALVTHTLGYVIYSVANQGWLIMISRLLAGFLLGAVITLGYTYFAGSSVLYVERQRTLGIKTDENSKERIKNLGFTSLIFGYSTGFVIGPGMAVIFAQFEMVNQFRAIGWFNVAYGVASLCLLVVMFRGEMQCEKLKNPCCVQCNPKQKETQSATTTVGPLTIFIIVSLIVFSFLERARYGVFQTLYNPIASDSFGINERYSSFLFLALAVPRFGGGIALLVLQKLKFSNQAIALIGILTTMTAYLLLTDFQAIPYDPCTEYSPFHHPSITNYNKSTSHTSLPRKHLHTNEADLDSISFDSSTAKLHVSNRVNFGYSNIDADFNFELANYECVQRLECSCTFTQPCLSIPIKASNYQKRLQTSTFLCSGEVKFCLFLNEQSPNVPSIYETKNMLELAEIDSINVLPKDVYVIAKKNCITANVTGRKCHWTPTSTIVKSECEDCQPICRSLSQTLTFAQFFLSFSLMIFSSSLQFTPIVALLTNQSPKHFLGIVIGIMTAANSIVRTISPLILDAIYEGVMKRTFAFTLALVILHIPFLIEIIILYPKLGPKKDSDKESHYSELKQEETE